MTTRELVVAEALTWEGTPYRHHGRIKGVGTDCAQILCAVFEAVGMTGPVVLGNYARDWHMSRNVEMYLATMRTKFTELPAGVEPGPGDVAVFRFGRTYSHGGIVISQEEILHAYVGQGVIRTRWRTEAPLADRQAIYFTSWA
jgi:NlpC/P60 family putative phage cell wall peptidase